MSKKSFKQGIESILKSTIHFDHEEDQHLSEENPEKIRLLTQKIHRYEEELKLWRTGRLNSDLFLKTLSESGLRYNPDKNNFEKII